MYHVALKTQIQSRRLSLEPQSNVRRAAMPTSSTRAETAKARQRLVTRATRRTRAPGSAPFATWRARLSWRQQKQIFTGTGPQRPAQTAACSIIQLLQTRFVRARRTSPIASSTMWLATLTTVQVLAPTTYIDNTTTGGYQCNASCTIPN